MRYLVGAFFIVMLSIGSISSAKTIEATTSSGKKVILYSDGTWVFKKDTSLAVVGKSTFSKPNTSTKVLKSRKSFFKLWINSAKWRIEKNKENPDAEFELVHSSGDAYALVIPERIAMPISSLKKIALQNAKSVAPDAKIVFEVDRIVNGTKVLCMRIDGTIEGIPFTYYGYYWTGKAGTLQVLTYTGQNLFDEFKRDLTDLLNGLVITKP